MEPVRLFRAALGVVILLAATYLFEPRLFGGALPYELMTAETFRTVIGFAGAVCGLLLLILGLSAPRNRPAPYLAFEPPAPARRPTAEQASPEPPPKGPEPEHDEAGADTPTAASPVEAGPTETDSAEPKRFSEIVVGRGLPPPPPKPAPPPRPF